MNLAPAAALLAFIVCTTSAAAVPELANQTIMTYSPGHGTQVEYFDKTGAWTYLWYPGNRGVNPGQVLWVEGPGNPPQLCFRYGPQIYEPLTGDSRGFDCAPVSHFESGIVARVKGDVFGLGDGTVPFVLTPERTTIEALRKKMKGGGSAAPGGSGQPSARTSFSSVKGSLYALAPSTPLDQIPALCDEIIARQDKNRAAMSEAGRLYYHGKLMGVSCVKIDYLKSLTLFRKAKDSESFNTFLRLVRQRAESGNTRAAAALKKIDTTPF